MRIIAGLAFGCVLTLLAMDIKEYETHMKAAGSALGGIRDAGKAKDAAAIGQSAAKIEDIFGKTQAFWDEKKWDDAIKMNQDQVVTAKALSAAAATGDWEKIRAANGALSAGCKSCHDAHREKLPDGTYRIK